MSKVSTGTVDHIGTPSDAVQSAPTSNKMPLLLQLAAMIGIGALVYPNAADWFSQLGHQAEVAGYVTEVEQLPEAARIDHIRAAQEYNSHMPTGVLRDPYTATMNDLSEDAGYRSYETVLSISDNGVIGEVQYPRLGMSLPIYHGTQDETLRKGIGHLYGSSLPVGGPSTHSVMTSHSGLVNASLFTRLPEAQIGDTFTVTVLGEQHHYEVRNLQTVLPEETQSLRIVEGEDWVTLITCTPIGINSHRLLVQAKRVPALTSEGKRSIAGDGRTAGFPWWALWFIGGSGLVAYLIFPHRKPFGQDQGVQA